MRFILLTTSAVTFCTIGSLASAQGVTLFGTSYLGLGYNIRNDGGAVLAGEEGHNNVRTVSRVEFGVNMTGTTDQGLTFGATIRADNAEDGQGGDFGQRAGEVFVSGSAGTLTFGDTAGADKAHVGNLYGNYSLTGLTGSQDTVFVSNGGAVNDDEFAANPDARPTLRYDYDTGSLGVSVSTNRDLTDIGVGASYTASLGRSTITGGVGYYNFSEFDVSIPITTTFMDVDGNEVTVPAREQLVMIPGGEQWSATVNGSWEWLSANLIYTKISADPVKWETVGAGATATFGDLSVGGFYTNVLSASNEIIDTNDAYGLTGEYDLGGGATVNGGIVRALIQQETVADLGIKLAF